MTNRFPLLFILPLLLAAGCVQSLHPLYTDKDLVFQPGLVGSWSEEGSDDVWIFERSGDKSYDLIYTEHSASAKFVAHLVQLGKFLFLDIYPHELDLDNDFQKAHFLPVHTFSRVWLQEDTLRLVMLDHTWLKDMARKKNLNLAHDRIGDQIVLTASTRELQKFMTRYAENPKAFPKPESGLIRRK